MRKENSHSTHLPPINQSLKIELSPKKYIIRPKFHCLTNKNSPSSQLITNLAIMRPLLTQQSDDETVQVKGNEIQELLKSSRTFQMDKTRGRVGSEAQFKFFSNYKNLEKLLCKKKNSRSTVGNDPTLSMLEVAEELKLLPCCMGFVKSNGDQNVINVKGQKFGDKYITAMSAGIKEEPLIESCQFSNNRITDQGLVILASSLSNEVTKIDISHNKITNICTKLLSLVLDPDSRLEYINLENNLISDKGATCLFLGLTSHRKLRYLNLRKNMLTKECYQSIEHLIKKTGLLEELYIGVNRINEDAGVAIIEALQENKTIKIFDYCMNNLSENNRNANPVTNNRVARALAKTVTVNKTLVHVDFSGNSFTAEQSKIIAQGLAKNKKIYGFHFHDNFGYIDSKGFLQVEDRENVSLHSIVHKHINSYDIVYRRQANSLAPNKFCNVCWICEGWYQQTFRFKVPEPSQNGKNFVFIHFDFDEFEPRLINISDVKVKYKTMVPPRKYRYFYTWNNRQMVHVSSSSWGTCKTIYGEKIRTHVDLPQQIEVPLSYTYQMNNEVVTFSVEQVSSGTGKPKRIVNAHHDIIVEVLPRQEGLVTKKEKIPWKYKDSVWAKEWKLEDDQITKNCFEKDWKCSKLTNLIKNQAEQDKVKDVLFKNYKLIKELYKHYASWSPFSSDIWAVSNNAFTEFCYLTKIISKDTPLTIIDLTFITTNSISGSDYKGNNLVPERGLVRFQFMEGLVRLSEEKFKKNGLTNSILSSVINLMDDHIKPLSEMPICNSEKWRLSSYFCQENDMLLKKYRPIFAQIYKKNSRMKVKPGNRPFMCLAEFKAIIERIGVAGVYVLQRDIFLSFNSSMMTQVDELDNERFIRMSEIEFIEAVARCAYILPDTCKIEDIFDEITPFYGKFEWIIHQLKSICSEEIKNMFSEEISLFGKSDED